MTWKGLKRVSWIKDIKIETVEDLRIMLYKYIFYEKKFSMTPDRKEWIEIREFFMKHFKISFEKWRELVKEMNIKWWLQEDLTFNCYRFDFFGIGEEIGKRKLRYITYKEGE